MLLLTNSSLRRGRRLNSVLMMILLLLLFLVERIQMIHTKSRPTGCTVRVVLWHDIVSFLERLHGSRGHAIIIIITIIIMITSWRCCLLGFLTLLLHTNLVALTVLPGTGIPMPGCTGRSQSIRMLESWRLWMRRVVVVVILLARGPRSNGRIHGVVVVVKKGSQRRV